MVDQDKILIYAIPETDDQAKLGDDQAVYGPRGMSHRSTNPPLTHRVLTETGSEHNAVAKTIVYRTTDDAGAQRIVEEFSNDLNSQGFTVAATPPGLPTARCFTQDTLNGTEDYCMAVWAVELISPSSACPGAHRTGRGRAPWPPCERPAPAVPA
jgi:hypothetical protein